MRVRTVVKVTAVLVVGLVVAAVAILRSIDFNRYRGLIAERVEAETGRRLTIQGDFDLRLFTLSPSIAVDDVAFANAPWGTRPDMVRIRRLEAEVALLPLFSGDVEVKRVVLVEPDILLETDAAGAGNWLVGGARGAPAQAAPAEAAGEGPRLPVVTEVRVEAATLTYLDGRTGDKTTLALERLSAAAESGQSPLGLAAAGSYNGRRFTASATVGPLAQLGDPDTPYPVTLEAEAGGAVVKVTGTVGAPLEGRGFDLALAVEGEELAALGAFAGADLPAAGPYRVSGRLKDDGAALSVGNLQAVLGRSGLAGEVVLVRGERPALRAELSSSLLDLTEWAGRKPAAGAPHGAAVGGEGPATGDGKRLFSDDPLPLAALSAIDAEVKLTAARIVTKGPSLENLTARLALNGGKLAVTPLAADIANGRLTAEATLDAGAAALAARLDVKEVDLAVLMKEMGIDAYVSGKGSFDAAITGRGGSLRAILAGLNGRTNLAVGEGRIDNALMEVMLADLAKAALGQGQDAKLNCVVSRFEITDGQAVSKALVIDADTVSITGEGDINLATEALNLTLTPEPKEASLATLAVPVKVKGTLASPTVFPDSAGVAKKAAVVAAGTITGVGALGLLAPLVPGSGGDDNPCARLLSGGASAPATGPAAATEEAAPGEEAQGPAGVLIEGIGDQLKSMGRGIKGIFE
jgi:uncharacterized protein involved in outer membrane biogenesis